MPDPYATIAAIAAQRAANRLAAPRKPSSRTKAAARDYAAQLNPSTRASDAAAARVDAATADANVFHATMRQRGDYTRATYKPKA